MDYQILVKLKIEKLFHFRPSLKMNAKCKAKIVKIVKAATDSTLFDDQWGEILPSNIKAESNYTFRDTNTGLVYQLAFVVVNEPMPDEVIYIE